MQYVVRDHIPLKELPLITPAADWPVFFASAMYAFEGIGLVGVMHVDEKCKLIDAGLGPADST